LTLFALTTSAAAATAATTTAVAFALGGLAPRLTVDWACGLGVDSCI
jgi:hypothetical protein